jgi:hypothetical protein
MGRADRLRGRPLAGRSLLWRGQEVLAGPAGRRPRAGVFGHAAEDLRTSRGPAPGRYSVIDLDSLGTSLDGRLLPKGFTEEGGTKRENGVETLLPQRAALRLADVLTIAFETVQR